MLIAKQMDIRSNIKKYFDLAYDGEIIFVSRKENKNVVIISEEEYNRVRQMERVAAYSAGISRVVANNSNQVSNSIKADNLRKLENISNLRDNWNGNGAPAIPKTVIEKTRKIIENIPIQPEIFPTALSSIQLEYDNSRRDHMELEIGESDEAEIFVVDYFGAQITENIPSTIEEITERIMQFYG